MRRALVVLAALALLPGCGLVNWIKGGKSNVAPPAPLVRFTPTAKITQLWSADLGTGPGAKFVRLSPAANAGVVYGCDARGHVSAYDAATGKRRWRVDLKAVTEGGTGYGDGLVLVGTEKGQVFALDADTGKQRWVASVSSEILAPPAAAEGVVVVQTVDGKLTGLSEKDGSALWVYSENIPPLTLRGTSAPVIIQNVVLTGFADGKVVAVSLPDGRPLWQVVVAEPQGTDEIERLVDVEAAPLAIGETLYAASYQGKIAAFDARTLRAIWSRDMSTYTDLAAGANNVYVTDAHGVVWALDQRTGAVVWKQNALHGRVLTNPMLVGPYVAVGDYAGYVHWLSRQDGSLVARRRIGSHAILAPGVVYNDTLYIADQDGKLVALRASPL